jgi:hypothetical protein
MRPEQKEDETMNTYEQIKTAFANLRKQGYIARRSFMCCSGCAGCAIANQVEAMPEAKRAKVRGAVFFTKQDAESFNDHRRGNLMIRYGRVKTQVGDFGDDTADVGKALCSALAAAGVAFDWDGDPDTCVEVAV